MGCSVPICDREIHRTLRMELRLLEAAGSRAEHWLQAAVQFKPGHSRHSGYQRGFLAEADPEKVTAATESPGALGREGSDVRGMENFLRARCVHPGLAFPKHPSIDILGLLAGPVPLVVAPWVGCF